MGIIESERFRVRRAISYRNSFLPVISGTIVPDAAGSRIDMVVRVTAPVAVVMILWLAGTACAAGVGVWKWLQTGETPALFALLLPLFGIVLVTVGFIPERRKAVELLAKAFDTTVLANRNDC